MHLAELKPGDNSAWLTRKRKANEPSDKDWTPLRAHRAYAEVGWSLGGHQGAKYAGNVLAFPKFELIPPNVRAMVKSLKGRRA